jgi:UvrD/REP helicase N-terminal domain
VSFLLARSGRMRVLTHRAAYLAQELGVASYRIIAVTFTNKAAGEIKEMIDALLNDGLGGGSGASGDMVAKLRAVDGSSAAGPDLLSARMVKLVLDDAPGSLSGSTGGEILCAVAQVFANGGMPADIARRARFCRSLGHAEAGRRRAPAGDRHGAAPIDLERSPAVCDIHGAGASSTAPSCCWREMRM